MSAWQRSHACESMKKSCGTVLPVSVSPELGKNWLVGPAPSWSMLAGAIFGLRITYASFRGIVRSHQAPAAMPAAIATHSASRNADFAVPIASHPRRPATENARIAQARILIKMCA